MPLGKVKPRCNSVSSLINTTSNVLFVEYYVGNAIVFRIYEQELMCFQIAQTCLSVLYNTFDFYSEKRFTAIIHLILSKLQNHLSKLFLS